MHVQPFKTSQFNVHCEGIYASDREIDWRRIGAIDKVSNIQSLLRTEKVQSVLEVGCGTGAVQNSLNTGHINSYSPESFSLLCQSSGLNILDSTLFDHSLDVYKFHTSSSRVVIKMGIHRVLLSANPILASRIFTYHFGVLSAPVRD
jgi:hypothetical protein